MTGLDPDNPEHMDLCAVLDGHYKGSLFTPEQVSAAQKRMDQRAVDNHQLSPVAFADTWGHPPVDTRHQQWLSSLHDAVCTTQRNH